MPKNIVPSTARTTNTGGTSIRNIIYAESGERKECDLAQRLSQRLAVVEGFGCSDCRCCSHLFFCSEHKMLENSTIASCICALYLPTTTICPPGKH